MDEVSQQEAGDSQQTLETIASQMSVDQECEESQSQMDISTDDVESLPQCSPSIPKQPKWQHEENPVSSTTDSLVPKETEKDNGLCQNGNEAAAEESEEEKKIQLIPEKNVAQEKLEEVEGQEKMKEEEGEEKMKEEEGQEKIKEGEGKEKMKEEEGQEKMKEEEGQEKMKEEEGQEKMKEEEGQEKMKEEEGQEKMNEGEGQEKMKEEEGQEKMKEEEGQEKMKEEEGKLKEDLTDSDMDEDEEDGFQFPKTLEGFMYAFNKEGRLRHIGNEEQGFKFEVRRNNHIFNQMHYEALGEVITEHIYELLETEAGLKRVYLDDSNKEESGFVFMSENALTTTDKLLILIHGSGVVRAGQWARRLIINDCLDSGTQIPYIQRAMKDGYEVLVMNTNDNFYITSDGRRIWKTGSSSPDEHGLNVWDRFVAETPVKHVAIVAHSYGGVVTLDLATNRMDSFGKVFAVAFTDSVHFMRRNRMFDDLYLWFVKYSVVPSLPSYLLVPAIKVTGLKFRGKVHEAAGLVAQFVFTGPEFTLQDRGQFHKENAVNWVSSNKPLDTVIDDSGYDCKRVSAGTTRHEETSHYSIDSIFQFLAKKEDEVKGIKPLNPSPGVAVPEMKETSDEVRKDEETEQEELKEKSSQGQETEIGPAETEV